MGLTGFSGSGGDANVWRIHSGKGAPDAPVPKALRLARSPSTPHLAAVVGRKLPQHPHLLPSGVVADAGGLAATIVPLLSGGSLAQRLTATGPLTHNECLIVVASISSALNSLHVAGLVHLDISPENIVLAADGSPVLVDTSNVQPATGQSCRRGTPPYTVPGADASPSTDWIALGRAVTELASGSTLTTTTRLPAPLRAPVAELLAGREPTAMLPSYSAGDLALEVYPNDYTLAPGQRTTIDFVVSAEDPESRTRSPRRRRKAWAACAVVLGLTAAFVAVSVATTNDEPSCPLSTSSAEALLASYPTATIVQADTGAECPTPVVWLPTSGELVVATSAGPQRFALGQRGDVLSLGDWNCDGSVTPALRRGAEFYVFDDWPQQASVTAHKTDSPAEVCTDGSIRRAE